MSHDLDISLRREPDGTVCARLSGELDYGNGNAVLARLSDTLQPGRPLVLVDLSGLYFCDSYGLACLLGLRSFAVGRGARIRVTGASGQPLRVLRTTGTYELLAGAGTAAAPDGAGAGRDAVLPDGPGSG